MNKELIARLRNGEIAAENNGTVEQLREVMKAAFPEDSDYPVGGTRYYYAELKPFWACSRFEKMPTVPITDFFKEDRAVALLREAKLQIEYLHQKCVVTGKQNSLLSEIEQFLNELNKDK